MAARASVVLPGGLLDRAGVLHRSAIVRPLRGRDEEWLRDLPLETTQARAVTEVLARAVVSVGPYRATRDIVRALPIGDRDCLAMRLYQITFGTRVEFVLRCAACGERMDADLDLESVPVADHPQQAEYLFRFEGRDLRFRLPRGADQESATSGTALLARCMVAGFDDAAPDAAVLAALDAAIEGVSPQVQASVDAACPECGSASVVAFDPCTALFRELYRRQRHFDRGVHLLSVHYHWPLSEILALTTARRERYLRLLEGELASA